MLGMQEESSELFWGGIPREVERPELGPCSGTYGMGNGAVQPL